MDETGRNHVSQRGHEFRWRLTDAKVAQLKESVVGARIPLLFAILWSFSWLAAIYRHDEGYTRVLIQRAQSAMVNYQCACSDTFVMKRYYYVLFHADSLAHARLDSLRLVARPTFGAVDSAQLHRDHIHSACESTLSEHNKELVRQQIQDWNFLVPWVGVKVTVFDLGYIGNAGIILLLLWFYYASRRENHAIRSFINGIQGSAEVWVPFFSSWRLYPVDKSLGPVHYAYGYQAVSQRFLFLTSSRNWALLIGTVILLSMPLLVTTYNSYTDFRDVLAWKLGPVGPRAWHALWLAVLVGILSYRCIRLQLMTSTLLNGWALASRDVWEKDEREDFADDEYVVVMSSEKRAERGRVAEPKPK